jgi:signal transduction histidine kinase
MAVVAFLARSEPRRPLSAWGFVIDAAIAVAATVGVVAQDVLRGANVSAFPAGSVYRLVKIPEMPVHAPPLYAVIRHAQLVGISAGKLPSLAQPGPVSALVLAEVALTAAPLLFRRRYPIASFAVILVAALVVHTSVPPLTFMTAVYSAYSAVVYSRYRQLAVGAVLAGAIAATIVFPNTLPHVAERYTALIVLMPTVAVALGTRELRRRAGDSAARLHRAQAEHESATERALEHERARIAAELHDVVTHNVSVMVVQAGAARKVIASAPGEAERALLAVESSGRTAMTELRSLLGLLCPGSPVDDEEGLRPQPGLADLRALADRVSATGLTVRLTVTGTPRDLPPGLDLAAYRVVQEGLTNVIRHAGEADIDVLIEWGAWLTITVSDDGRGARRATQPGRGLVGLRERLALYGGTLAAGSNGAGGWRLSATIPLPAGEEERVFDPDCMTTGTWQA